MKSNVRFIPKYLLWYPIFYLIFKNCISGLPKYTFHTGAELKPTKIHVGLYKITIIVRSIEQAIRTGSLSLKDFFFLYVRLNDLNIRDLTRV